MPNENDQPIIVCFSSGEAQSTTATVPNNAEDFAPIERTGKYFEVGKSFKDAKGIEFSLTEEEADKIIADFQPVDINHAHSKRIPGPLDGMFGKVEKLWRDGKDILANYSIPAWLHRITKGQPIPTSAEFDFATKKPLGAGLVAEGAVSDAIMFAAFATGATKPEQMVAFAQEMHKTPTGQNRIQEIHDAAVRAGSVCKKGNTAEFASRKEADAIQQVHDICMDCGATCEKVGTNRPYYFASSDDTSRREPTKGKPNMKKPTWEDFVNFFNGGGGQETQTAPEPVEMAARLQRAEQQLATERAEKITTRSAAIAKAAVQGGKIMPHQQEALTALFARAMLDDAADETIRLEFSILVKKADEKGEVSFAKEQKKVGRVEALVTLVGSLPDHGILSQAKVTEQLPDDLRVIFSRETTETDPEAVASAAEQKRLMELTDLGQKTLAAQKGGN